jgi:hypothetical protein
LRVARLTDKFALAAARLGAIGGETGSKIGRVVSALERADVLPAPGDSTTLVGSDERGISTLQHVRRVPGRNLWLWYTASDDEVVLHALTDEPPTRG